MKSLSEILTDVENEINRVPKPYEHLYAEGEERNKFPHALLSMPANDRYLYFKGKIAAHDRLSRMTNQVVNFILQPDRPFGVVIGPPNVGKTTLFDFINKDIFLRFATEMQADRGFIPVCFTEMPNPESRVFRWNVVYTMAEGMLNETLNSRIDLLGSTMSHSQYKPPKVRFLNALRNRKVRTIQFDEGQCLVRAASQLSQLDELKFLGNVLNIPIMIYGTYEMIQFLDLNAQLAVRTREFHFNRYLPLKKNSDDFSKFVDVLGYFEAYLPLVKPPVLVDRAEEIYWKTAGCVGILKRWLTSCLSAALERQQETIDDACLFQHAYIPGKLLRLASDIEAGERYMEEREKCDSAIEEKIQEKLGVGEKNITHEKNAQTGLGPKPNLKPGKRTPGRDPIVPPFRQ